MNWKGRSVLTSKNITRRQVRELLELLEDYTRYDVAARLGDIPRDLFTNLTQVTVDKMDEIRRFVYGSDDMVKLGLDWGILKARTRKRKKKKCKKK